MYKRQPDDTSEEDFLIPAGPVVCPSKLCPHLFPSALDSLKQFFSYAVSYTHLQIFTDYDSGVAAGRIAQNLKGRNICNAKGKVSWTHASIGRILENPSSVCLLYTSTNAALRESVRKMTEKWELDGIDCCLLYTSRCV